MMTLKDSIEINATPEKVFQWLLQRFKYKVDATEQHINEEGENLKRAVEREDD
jgi:hypothetical protein